MTPQIHLCIVSGQSLPNLLPLFVYRPQHIALAVSSDMENRIQAMTATLLKAGLVERVADVVSLPSMPDSNYAAMLEWSRQQTGLLRHHFPDHQLVFNCTGGTKLMSQALALACQEQPNSAVLYCDTAHDRIEWLAPTLQQDALPADLLDSATICKANSIDRESALSDDTDWRNRVAERADLTRWLASGAGSVLGSFIPALNDALVNLRPELFPQDAAFKQPARSAAWREALRRLEKQQLLILTEPLVATAPARVRVESEDALRYLRGGWLEEYLWRCMQDADLHDVHCSVQISAGLGAATPDNPDESKLNELDIVVGHRNRVLVIECKTADLERNDRGFNQMLDKLDSLGKRTGGLLTQCWLVAARWPHRSLIRQNRLRLLARSRNIVLVEPRHLADLPARIQSWKTNLQLPLD